ncbi:MAG: metallophosphoesterase [Bacteroidaceae bacterium]
MLLRILIFLIIGLTLPAYYIDRCFLKRTSLRLLLWLPNLVLLLLAIVLTIFENFTPWNVWAKGIFLVFYMCIAIPETIFTLLSLLGLLFRKQKPILYKVINGVALMVAISSFSSILIGYFYGYKHIVTKEFHYESADIPQSFDGYRIVQFSDLHIGSYSEEPEIVNHIVQRINELKADAIVFTGDLVNYRSCELVQFKDVLAKLNAKDGVFSIMGNHDYMSYYHWENKAEEKEDIRKLQTLEKEMGWNLLLNDSHNIARGNDTIAIIGVENDGKPPFPQYGDLPKAMRKLSTNIHFKILLSHDPTHWKRSVLPETNIPLMLAGHTHGMQFKIGNFSPALFVYNEWDGIYYEKARALIVSIGLGQVLLPLRFGAWPEIEVITLHSKKL